MEMQFNRVARRFWRIESTAELTDEWTNRLAKMAAALSRYRKNAYEYIWAKREAGHWIGDKEGISRPRLDLRKATRSLTPKTHKPNERNNKPYMADPSDSPK